MPPVGRSAGGIGRNAFGGPLRAQSCLLGIALALLANKAPAQTVANPEFQLPRIASGGDTIRSGPKQRLLNMIRNRNWTQAARLAGGINLAAATDPQLHYLAGVVRWQQQDKVAAIQRFRAAERLGLREAYLHNALGIAYYDAHQFILFKQQMQRAIEADPADPQPHYYLGRYAQSVTGDHSGALRHLERVVGLDPGHARGHSYLAYSLERIDRRAAAKQHYQTSAELLEREGVRLSWPYKGLARLALESEPQAATGWAKIAVEVGPEDFEAHALLARSHERNGDLPKAVEAADEAVRINPDHAASHYLLFTAYRRLGDTTAAQLHMSRFQELKQAYGDQ